MPSLKLNTPSLLRKKITLIDQSSKMDKVTKLLRNGKGEDVRFFSDKWRTPLK